MSSENEYFPRPKNTDISLPIADSPMADPKRFLGTARKSEHSLYFKNSSFIDDIFKGTAPKKGLCL